jgi:predicted metal-dependent hydrolase
LSLPEDATDSEAAGWRLPLNDLDWTQGDMADGLQSYQAGEFFAAHEAWENVWLQSQEPAKTFLQGLIQVTAAFHHLRRNNPRGATVLLQAALGRLARYPKPYGGISVAALCDDIRERLRSLEGDESASPIPIRMRSR